MERLDVGGDRAIFRSTRSVRFLLLLALAVGLALPAAAAAEPRVIPYLSGGAGVYVDVSGWPVGAEGRPSPPAFPGIHPRPPRLPAPTPDPVFVIDPVLGGYHRDDLSRVAGIRVVCLTDAAWPPAAPPASTGAWDGARIAMRLSRCEALVPSRVGTELFARGLFVLAHEAVHAGGQPDECEADRGAIARMPSYAAALGFGEAAGIAARDLLLAIYRAAPLPPPYCLGSF